MLRYNITIIFINLIFYQYYIHFLAAVFAKFDITPPLLNWYKKNNPAPITVIIIPIPTWFPKLEDQNSELSFNYLIYSSP